MAQSKTTNSKAALKDLPKILRLFAQPEMDNGQTMSIAKAEKMLAKSCFPAT